MFFVQILAAFVAFPQKNDAIFHYEDKKLINVEASGSIGLYHYSEGKCIKTHPNETLISSDSHEWCSNIAKEKDENPWIQFSIKGKQMKISSYAIRNGCCRYPCCCTDDETLSDDYCCCRLFSFSLHASNDNKTWTLIHKVEKESKFDYCLTKEYHLEKQTNPYTYFRLSLDEPWPGCIRCLQINEIELYGEAISSGFFPAADNNDEDETVSIIGRIKRGEQ